MQDILGDVAKKFSGYADSAAKTALAQNLFGKSGAELIPVLNDIGDKGLPGVIKQAEEFGAAISGETAKRAEEFNDNLTRLAVEAKGFATAVVDKLLPSLNTLTGDMVTAGKTTDGYRSAAEGVATAVKGMTLVLLTAKEVISGMSTIAIFAFFDASNTVFTAAGNVVEGLGPDDCEGGQAQRSRLMAPGSMRQTLSSRRASRKSARMLPLRSKSVKAGLTGGIGDAVARATANYDALFQFAGQGRNCCGEGGQ